MENEKKVSELTTGEFREIVQDAINETIKAVMSKSDLDKKGFETVLERIKKQQSESLAAGLIDFVDDNEKGEIHI